MVEVVVARLGIDSASGGYVVILRERAGLSFEVRDGV